MSTLPDFDTLAKLAKENPLELERLRQDEVAKLIEQAPEDTRKRLKGLQFQIDAQRRLHKDSPMGTCMVISKMMHESFAELCVWMNIITGKDTLDPVDEFAQTEQSATVLPFTSAS